MANIDLGLTPLTMNRIDVNRISRTVLLLGALLATVGTISDAVRIEAEQW